MWIDIIKQNEFFHSNQLEKSLFEQAKKYYQQNPDVVDLAIQHTAANPILSKTMVNTLANMRIPVESQATEQIADTAQEHFIVQESEKWNEVNEKFKNEVSTDNMHLNVIDVLSGGLAPGGRTRKEVGGWSVPMWAIGTLDAIRESWNKWNPLPTSDILQFGGGGVPYRAQGRIWRYFQDLQRYDDLLEKGYTPETAQANIASLVNISEVPNLGRNLGDKEFQQNIEFLQEAIKFAGENYIWTAAKKVMSGQAVNMDRSKKFFFESIQAEEDPKYQELLMRFKGDEKKAKDLYYLQVGSPIKEKDGAGNIYYTGLDDKGLDSNKIKIFSDRRTNYNDMNVSEYAQREIMEDDQLSQYSWGRYEAGQVFQQGTTAYKVASGLLDFASALPAEYATGGLLKLGQVFKGARLMNRGDQARAVAKATSGIRYISKKSDALQLQDEVLEAQEALKLLHVGDMKEGKYLNVADKDLARWKQVKQNLSKGEIDELVMKGDDFIDIDGGYFDMNPIKNSQIKTALKLEKKALRKTGLLNGRLQRLFNNTPESLGNLPETTKLLEGMVGKTGTELSQIPRLKKLVGDKSLFWDKMAETIKEDGIEGGRRILIEMMGTGLEGSKIGLKDEFFKIPGLPAGFSYSTNRLMRKLPGVSDDFAMRSLGGMVGRTGRIAANVSRLPKQLTVHTMRKLRHTDEPVKMAKVPQNKRPGLVDSADSYLGIIGNAFKTPDTTLSKYLGFSGAYRNGAPIEYFKIFGEMAESGLRINNKIYASRQLIKHMQQNKYTYKEMDSWMKKWYAFDETGDFTKKLEFAKDLLENDYRKIKRQGGQHEVIAKHIEDMVTEWNEKTKAYFKSNGLDESGMSHNMPFPGSKTQELSVKIPGGFKNTMGEVVEEIVIQVPSAHLLSDLTDNLFPFLNQTMVDRVNGKVFYAVDYTDLKPWDVSKIGATNFKNFMKGWYKDSYKVSKAEHLPHGWIPTNRTMDDAMTKVLDFYTSKLFKPIVLLRPAFLTRIFMEEQARMYAAGLDNIYSHPFRYMSWMFSHSDKKMDELWKLHDNFDDIQRSAEMAILRHQQWQMQLSRGGKFAHNYPRSYKQVDRSSPLYVKAWYREIFHLRADPVSRYVAKQVDAAGNPLTFDDKIEWFINGKGDVHRQALKDGTDEFLEVATNDEAAIAYLKSVENRIRQVTGMTLVPGEDYMRYAPRPSRATARGQATTDLETAQYSHNIDKKAWLEGSNLEIRNIIANGHQESILGDLKMLDSSLGPNRLKTVNPSDKKAIEVRLQKFLDDNKDFNLGTLWYEDVLTPVASGAWSGERQLDTGVNYFFGMLMDRPLNYLNRSTTFYQYRWGWISNHFHLMDTKLQDKFIKEAKVTLGNQKLRNIWKKQFGKDLPEAISKKGMVATLEDLQKSTKGGIKKYTIDSYDSVSTMSKGFGLQATQDLLYDVTRRHNISNMSRNIVPFPEVWFEMFTTWPKLLAENPKIVNRARLGLKGGKGASGMGYTGDGFFAEDPNGSGEDMFVMPFGGWMSNLIFGEDSDVKMSPRGYVTGVNILGQGFVPGPTPLAGHAINTVIPESDLGDSIREALFGDFGPPSGKTFWDKIIPNHPSLQKGFAAAGWSPGGSEGEVNAMRASTSLELFKLLKTEGAEQRLFSGGELSVYLEKYEWQGTTADKLSFDELPKDIVDASLRDYAAEKSKQTFLFRFLAQFFLPTGFSPRYYIEDKDGKLWGSQILAKEYQNIVEGHGGDHIAAYETFVRIYGFEHTWLTTPKSVKLGGKAAYSQRVKSWQRDNQEAITLLEKSAFYLLPDNPAEERTYSDLIEEYNIGTRDSLTLKEFNVAGNDTIGYYRYSQQRRLLERSGIGENIKNMLLRTYRTALQQEYPGFMATGGLRQPYSSKEILQEMLTLWPNLEVAQTTEAGRVFINEFIPMWEQNARASTMFSPSKSETWWLESEKPTAVYMRANFHSWAMEIIQDNPDFAPIYTNIITRMFRNDKEFYSIKDY